jgi:hypothetical protein
VIPITQSTITAVAALVYNHAYDQDPDCGWLADDGHSAPGRELQWLEWTTQLLKAMQEMPEASDEQVIALAKQRVDCSKVGHSWDTIPMDVEYSTISAETDVAMPLVRDFLDEPHKYAEVSFIEADPEYLAYLELPLSEEQQG